MNIEEIALRVCKKLNVNGSGLYEKMVIEAAQAELSKDVEPYAYDIRDTNGAGNVVLAKYVENPNRLIAVTVTKLFTHPAPVIASEQKPVAVIRNSHQIDFIGSKDLPAGTELFTSPPNTADIEQRVAEACANVLERLAWRVKPASANEVAEELRSGKWREYP